MAGDVIVDADVHNSVGGAKDLLPFLSEYWREQVTRTGFSGPFHAVFPAARPTSRADEYQGGEDPGASLAALRRELLDRKGLDYAILNCAYAAESIHNPDAAAAMAAAVNDWQIANWLDPEPRLRASIVLPSEVPELAVKEIERVGDHPGFVQISLPVRSARLYGRREYLPMLEAAVQRGLAVGLQYGGFSGGYAPTSVGWPSYFIEDHVGMALVAQSQLLNLLAEGVFDRLPEIRIVFVDCGFTWLPALMWRVDKDWKGLRRETPWVRELPSEYFRRNVRFTTAPVDAPAGAPDLLEFTLEQMWGDELLMFASDFPHWRSEDRETALMQGLTAPARERVMGMNAADVYGLRPTDPRPHST